MSKELDQIGTTSGLLIAGLIAGAAAFFFFIGTKAKAAVDHPLQRFTGKFRGTGVKWSIGEQPSPGSMGSIVAKSSCPGTASEDSATRGTIFTITVKIIATQPRTRLILDSKSARAQSSFPINGPEAVVRAQEAVRAFTIACSRLPEPGSQGTAFLPGPTFQRAVQAAKQSVEGNGS
jgi:hypothetical protein